MSPIVPKNLEGELVDSGISLDFDLVTVTFLTSLQVDAEEEDFLVLDSQQQLCL